MYLNVFAHTHTNNRPINKIHMEHEYVCVCMYVLRFMYLSVYIFSLHRTQNDKFSFGVMGELREHGFCVISYTPGLVLGHRKEIVPFALAKLISFHKYVNNNL